MVLRVAVLAGLAACGKMNFDDASNMDGIAHDEDLDGINDPMDNCPAAFNDRQEDEDNDGVGDACDPNPTTPGDRLIAFGFFTDSFGDWVPDSAAAWVFEDGSIAPAQTDPDAVAVSLSTVVTAKTPTIEILFTVLDYGPAMEIHQLGVTISFANQVTTCNVVGSNGNRFSAFELVFGGVNQALPAPIDPGMTTPLRLTRDATGATCRVGPGTLSNAAGPPQSSTATLTIDIRNARIGITSAVVYDVP
jgi:hypothetical protein